VNHSNRQQPCTIVIIIIIIIIIVIITLFTVAELQLPARHGV